MASLLRDRHVPDLHEAMLNYLERKYGTGHEFSVDTRHWIDTRTGSRWSSAHIYDGWRLLATCTMEGASVADVLSGVHSIMRIYIEEE